MLEKVCGWCNQSLGETIDDGSDKVTRSHGVCRSCGEALLAGSGIPMQAFIDSLEIPIFVVDENGAVVISNSAGAGCAGKTKVQIQGKLGGEVFNCKNHSLPGGCGQTIHCKTCTIRNSVMETFRTGKSLQDVPAYLDLDNFFAGSKSVSFRISTEKKGDVVMLKILEMKE